MPTIAIRAHGVSASKFQQLVNPETGEIVKLADLQPPERTATRGWTVNVARRNEQRLQQIDFDAIDGIPAFVTLTMPSQQMGGRDCGDVPFVAQELAEIYEDAWAEPLLLDSGVSGQW